MTSSPVTTQRPTGGKLRLMGLDDLDGRTNAARAAYALRDAIIADAGGAETLSALKLELIATVAVQTALLNDLHARLLSGDPHVQLSDLSTLTNTRNRTAAMCGGMTKMTKTLDLDAYMRSTYGNGGQP
ncbi:hypothetical protein J5289_16250 [Rhizobium sp. B230/85]|uniref:hypothetical protein n=1 Tax=unclassified Rhizobium TaxID=2613769 RepID=UPI001AD9BAD3|nr:MULTISPECIES: hypothetical protein [unclassified Rhizobium]MBO9131724.1 hypothetical protein [Rhizobium sp. B209b/85]QXZ95708.1 hypothetical protein J5289_16250 [Rhizobium sp. B230/85]